MERAVSRRLQQELGFECPLTLLYKFKYHAQYGTVGAEHEYCWVYYGRYDGTVNVNLNEVADWRFVGIDELEAELESEAESVSESSSPQLAAISATSASIASSRRVTCFLALLEPVMKSPILFLCSRRGLRALVAERKR